jgi:hypothetical protein
MRDRCTNRLVHFRSQLMLNSNALTATLNLVSLRFDLNPIFVPKIRINVKRFKSGKLLCRNEFGR